METDQVGLSGLPEFCPSQGHLCILPLGADFSFQSSLACQIVPPCRSRSQRCFQLDQSQELVVQKSFCHILSLLSCISTKAPQPPGLWGKNDCGNLQKTHTGVRQTYFKSARREASEREVRNSLEEFLQPCSMSCLPPLSWGPNQYGFK